MNDFELKHGERNTKGILLVDDALTMRIRLKDILAKGNHDVIGEAENGVEAVEKYKELRPGLVLMDISMPEMSGILATRAIKVFDPDALIIMCTAMGQETMVREAVQAGATDFICKPVKENDLLDKVQKLIG
ncbi:MAG: response regulator [Defluviitaleaceae bacterium]|nr:response regulator [Defluviitaleaceae bacterium]